MGLAALWHAESFQTRDGTGVPCTGSHRFLTTGPPGKSEMHFKDRGDRTYRVDAASESKGKSRMTSGFSDRS